ncbi:MAG: HD domain-containing protein [Bacilli bacterium]|nr:HD domain-containing protein [Bacilli bacterium]
MNKYLENLDPTIKEYFKILSDEFPDFLLDYIYTPRMQKQDLISVSCGTYYSKMFNINLWYSSLEHSVAVALIIWHFTHDKKQKLAGLFHDISTPVFKHCIDFMNGDFEQQESTEDLTEKLILESQEIMNLLKRDKIDIDSVSDYHIYPIADNDTPRLSADRLEYTLSNGLGQTKKIWNLDEIKEIYNNIEIIKNEDNELEMCFTNLKLAERFVEVMSELSICYMNDKRRFGMQFLADIMKIMSENNLISVNDLYELSEHDVIVKIKTTNDYNISECFKIWQNSKDIKTSNKMLKDKYCINVKAKRRYINPLVKIDNKIYRISDISDSAKENINKCLTYTFDRYLYMNFNFDKKKKTLVKK